MKWRFLHVKYSLIANLCRKIHWSIYFSRIKADFFLLCINVKTSVIFIHCEFYNMLSSLCNYSRNNVVKSLLVYLKKAPFLVFFA